MTIRHQIELETATFILIAIFLSSFFVWRSNQNFQYGTRANTPIVSEDNSSEIIVPSVNPTLGIETSSQISPDGTKKLNMKKSRNSDGTSTFVFTVTDRSGANEHEVYTTKIQSSENLSIPFNTWSPDDKYLFIQRDDNSALVFKATGERVTSDQTYYNVGDLFKDKIKNVILQEVTGWASPTLLVVNSVKKDNSKRPSFWFEVPSQAIMQLSSQF